MIRTSAQHDRATGTALAGALLCLLCLAAAARAQEAAPLPVPADSLGVRTVEPARGAAATAADSLAAAAAAGDTAALRRIDPGMIDFASATVDLWDTGLSPTGAVLMTPVFPGWGQLYADNSWRAALAYGTQMYFWTNIISRDRQARRARDFAGSFDEGDPNRARYDALADELWEQMRDFAWWSGGVLLIVALDAYVGAHLFDFDRDPVPVPDRWDDEFGPPGGDLPGGAMAPQYTVFQWRTSF